MTERQLEGVSLAAVFGLHEDFRAGVAGRVGGAVVRSVVDHQNVRSDVETTPHDVTDGGSSLKRRDGDGKRPGGRTGAV